MFYEQMAAHYHHIFPASPKVPFLAKSLSGYHNLLDIGCSDGRVAQALNFNGHSVTGIDLSDSMIHIAQNLDLSPTLRFAKLDMLEIENHLGRESFHGLYCIGNTLVHLPTSEAVHKAIEGFYQTLKSDGRMVLQILNYNWFLKHRPSELPLIDNKEVCFERRYAYLLDGPDELVHHVEFSTKLTIKSTGEVYEGNTQLLPLTKEDLESMALEVGFVNLTWYADYNGTPFHSEASTLILVADKDSSTIIKNPEK